MREDPVVRGVVKNLAPEEDDKRDALGIAVRGWA